MRLLPQEVESIKKTYDEIFHEGKLYLFGSRVWDDEKGGDIDLYLCPLSKENLYEKKIIFLARLKEKIGDQKIDVILSKDPKRYIEVEALNTGLEL